MPSRIEDYALIGDCHTAALVARDGSIDWLCLPRFDSGACFAALLGTNDHGRWRIAPAAPVISTTRRYRDGTPILETTFTTEDGEVTVIDFMPRRTQQPDLVRIVVGKRGHVRMRMDMTLRFDYGAAVPWVRHTDERDGIRATAGPDTVTLRTSVALRGEHLSTVGEFDVTPGSRVPFVLAWQPTYESAPPPRNPEDALRETESWWQEWSGRCTYDGKWRDAVLRSLITLKALTYAPTGGIVAAPTASLPEQIGGERNWDYRYCWLRDATFTLMALDVGGYTEEARAWRKWLLNAVAGRPDDMQIMYGIAGERRLPEWTADWLPGYEQSRPVRFGNAAFQQHQTDVYGELIDALFQARHMGLNENDDVWHIERHLINFLQDHWEDADRGIWETRGPERQFTLSKAMSWVAMDRAVKTIEQFGQPGDLETWRKTRDRIHAQVCAEGFNPKVNAFTAWYGSEEPDAGLLMLPLIGFLPPNDPRILGTMDLVQQKLTQDGLVRRHANGNRHDGVTGEEGAFLICSFWLADNLALAGRTDEATELFEHLLSLRNDVGLLSEEFDPTRRRFLGNFPQAFSHVGLINSARNLSPGRPGGRPTPASARSNPGHSKQ